MSDSIYVAKAYLLLNCPFSFKFLLFMTEAGLLEQIEIITFDAKENDYVRKKAKLEDLLGSEISFPTVEIEQGIYKSDSDALIDHYSKKNGIINKKLVTLEYYKNGIFDEIIHLFKENRALKSKMSGS